MRGEGAPPTIVAGVADPGLSAVALAKADAGLNPFDKLRAPSPSRGEAGYISIPHRRIQADRQVLSVVLEIAIGGENLQLFPHCDRAN